MRFLYGLQKYNTKTIGIAGRRYKAIMADTPTKRAIGLMFRERLPQGSCMLFIFGHPGRHEIWMRNMGFPIDAVWTDRDGAIVDIKERLEPCNSIFNCPQYGPGKEASYLIELNAGEASRRRLRKGSKLSL